jgi:hypothetical protein
MKKLHRQELRPDSYGTYRTVFGRVVGIVRRYEGRVSGWGAEGEFTQTGNKLLVQVKPSWTGKIVEALPEDIEPADARDFPYQGTYEWTDANRADQAEEMKDRERDEKGRWLPDPPPLEERQGNRGIKNVGLLHDL